ncbi:hypothetical protein CL689_00380 [Candidatus Saccharibacteria bacterium]|nr:hypothetical protein [Candidatus Saccharibacteria bacterium]MBJ58654.1 hypothetical protein [Candidatus Saccharibacteria bacterium]MBQ68505.1 hypothetical protein [Candidatus Saccharibacteria bacterium]|tara:strand:+ start:445 stop:1425 length:981 start_codon:yes stop_codon:yes gene_type:complete
MAKGKRKLDAKAFAQQKRHRRQWVTFIRMCRYGVNNFSRNAWLTVAATAVMTITLFIIFTSVVSRQVLVDTLAVFRDNVTMAIYVDTDTDEEDVATIQRELEALDSVVSVNYTTPAEAREQFVQDQRDNVEVLEAVTESDNKFPGTFDIVVEDINDTTELKEYTDTSELVQDNKQREPSFAGERRQTIENIGRTVNFAQQVGIGLSIVFVVVSMLIIFNTIRMAIFNRREEIQMMKLIGAERSFIRGPFLVEAIVYGFFAAIVASALGYGLLYGAAPTLAAFEINVQPTIDFMTFYAGFIVLAMIVIGAIIGVVSSLLATRRYLRL